MMQRLPNLFAPWPGDDPFAVAGSGAGRGGGPAHPSTARDPLVGSSSSSKLPALDLSATGFAQLLFENANDAFYILDLQSQRYLSVNSAFCELTGYSQQELLSGTVTAADLLAPSDSEETQRPYRRRADALGLESSEELPAVKDRLYVVSIKSRNHGVRLCEVSIQQAEWHGRPVTLGCARDITAPMSRQQALRESVEREREQAYKEREKTRHSIEANVRIMQITERIMRTPRFTKLLEAYPKREQVLSEACEFLTSPQGMELAQAGLFLFDESRTQLIRRAASPEEAYPEVVDAEAHPELAGILYKKASYAEKVFDEQSVAVPMHIHGRIEGMAVVTFHPDTHRIITPDEAIRRTLLEVLVTLTDVIGHRLETLDLIEKLRQQAVIDDLTGVYNRRFFDERLQRELDRAKRYGREITLTVMDIDHFKEVNDNLGHPQGDLLLKEFARLLEQHTRNADIVCRLGGDEFAIILPETDLTKASHLAEKLRREVERTSFHNLTTEGEPVSITISVGVADGERGTISAPSLYSKADVALYDSKDAGRNCVTQGTADPASENEAREGREPERR